MPFLAFSQSSLNVAFVQASGVFPSGHAEHYKLIGEELFAYIATETFTNIRT
jgi:hypothetical protein